MTEARMKFEHPEELLPYLHGSCGFFSAGGGTGFARFTPEQLAFYGGLNDSFYIASHTAAGIYLDFYTDIPEISFRYRLYRSRGTELLNSGFDIWEDARFGAHISICDSDELFKAVYCRRSVKPSRIRIFFPNGNVYLMEDFCLGDAVSAERQDKKILFYGDSITQSAYIANPSLSWYGLTAEYLGAEYVNRGVGSMVFDENSLPASDPYQPDTIIIEYGANDLNKMPDKQSALAAASAWLKKACAVYPDAQKIGITPDFIYPHGYDDLHWQRFHDYCDDLYCLYQAMNIPVLRGYTLVPDLSAMFREDHVHLNETGSAWFAGHLVLRLKEYI